MLKSSTVQRSAVQYSAVQRSAAQRSAAQRSAAQHSTVKYSAVHKYSTVSAAHIIIHVYMSMSSAVASSPVQHSSYESYVIFVFSVTIIITINTI